MLKRHEIVVRIIDANSRQVRLDKEINGLDIERRLAERDLDEASGESKARDRLASIAARICKLREDSERVGVEQAWLDQVLAEFDGASLPEATPKTGRA